MSRFITISLAALLTTLFALSADAQKKPIKKTSTKTSSTKATSTVVPPLEVRTGREKVDNQRVNVSLFVDRLGPIAQSIEDFEASAKANPPASSAAAANDTNKQKVVTAIRNLKAGLADLESEFRTKPALQKYLPSIQGITDLASRSEDDALAGRFVASKDPLRQVLQKLTDALGTIPQ
jgi:hypothetical protein